MPNEVGKGRQKSPCSVRNLPVPDLFICPACRHDMEIWSDEQEGLCSACGKVVVGTKSRSADSLTE